MPSRSRFKIEPPTKDQQKEIKFIRKDDMSGESVFLVKGGNAIAMRSESFSMKNGRLGLHDWFLEVEYGRLPSEFGFKEKDDEAATVKEKPIPIFEDPEDNEIAKNISLARKKGLEAPHRMKRVNENAQDAEGRMTILGKSLCSVLRKLGASGVGPNQAMAICLANGLNPAVNTVKIQIGKGVRGVGPMADLTDDQILSLVSPGK